MPADIKMNNSPVIVGMGSYTINSHNVQRYNTEEGFVQNEGDIGIKGHSLQDCL